MAEDGQVISCHTVKAWKDQIEMSKQSKKLVVVDFTASWCAPCRVFAPVFAEIARKTPSITFLKVDVDELLTVSQECAVESVPTFIFLKEGKVVDKVVGAKKEDLQLAIAKHATATA